MSAVKELLTIKEASEWATKFLKRNVTESNISYLIQYGKVKKYNGNGTTRVSIKDLLNYYEEFYDKRRERWKKHLGEDLNWALSFEEVREKERTKHVHRLHPYKGKFIPQLVEYFLDNHIDEFKRESFFREGDIVLDPFCGSGTTLVQANELKIHSVGIDVSRFNCMITEVKLLNYDLQALKEDINKIQRALLSFRAASKITDFESELAQELYLFNSKFFPSPEYKYKVSKGLVKEESYGRE
ncbi:MAG: site-specific DNA-methyltransferase, partial [Candidatus Dadabacteria bacterium]